MDDGASMELELVNDALDLHPQVRFRSLCTQFPIISSRTLCSASTTMEHDVPAKLTRDIVPIVLGSLCSSGEYSASRRASTRLLTVKLHQKELQWMLCKTEYDARRPCARMERKSRAIDPDRRRSRAATAASLCGPQRRLRTRGEHESTLHAKRQHRTCTRSPTFQTPPLRFA